MKFVAEWKDLVSRYDAAMPVSKEAQKYLKASGLDKFFKTPAAFADLDKMLEKETWRNNKSGASKCGKAIQNICENAKVAEAKFLKSMKDAGIDPASWSKLEKASASFRKHVDRIHDNRLVVSLEHDGSSGSASNLQSAGSGSEKEIRQVLERLQSTTKKILRYRMDCSESIREMASMKDRRDLDKASKAIEHVIAVAKKMVETLADEFKDLDKQEVAHPVKALKKDAVNGVSKLKAEYAKLEELKALAAKVKKGKISEGVAMEKEAEIFIDKCAAVTAQAENIIKGRRSTNLEEFNEYKKTLEKVDVAVSKLKKNKCYEYAKAKRYGDGLCKEIIESVDRLAVLVKNGLAMKSP